MAVTAHVDVGRDGAISDDNIEPMDGQIGEQMIELAFTTDYAYRLRQMQRGLQQQVGNHLRHRISQPHTQLRGTAIRTKP